MINSVKSVALAALVLQLLAAPAAARSQAALGTITGTVRDSANAPVQGAFVYFNTSAGVLVSETQTDAFGSYASPGLNAGTYYVWVSAPYGSGLVDELYNDISCPGGACPLVSGSAVPVAAGGTTTNISFALATGGRIQGTITNEQTGSPVAEAWVFIYSSAGTAGRAPLTPAAGTYTSTALPTGIYYVEAFAPRGSGLRDERYVNVSCVGVPCLLTTGTPVAVTAPAATSIDFALTPGAMITGTVTTTSDTPLPGVSVQFFAENGAPAGGTVTNDLGAYASPGLPSGSYFLRTLSRAPSAVVDELYDDTPCPAEACDVRNGTAVGVSGTNTVANVNFVLPPTSPPLVTTDPSDLTVWEGQNASFTVAASGAPAPTVQWQVSSDGGAAWTTITGPTAPTILFVTARADTGKRFRGVFTNAAGTATSGSATLTVMPCDFSTTPASIVASPDAMSRSLSVAVGAGCAWTAVSNAPWLSIASPGSGLGNGTIGILLGANTSIDARVGVISIGSYGVTVTQAGLPAVTLDKLSLRFSATSNGNAFTSQTAAQIVRVTQSGPGTVSWTATSDQPWLVVNPTSGKGTDTLTIAIQFSAALPMSGSRDGGITLSFSGSANVPGPITINLAILPAGASDGPFGAIDTPIENTTGVTGSLPFTGWALDDVEVARVSLCREPVSAEAAQIDARCNELAQIYIGDAVFIDGARPDVQSYYPSYPLSRRAGWGLMVLTNMLPDQGNGAYKFHAYATDRDGHTARLGTRTLTCDNAHATSPFGAIDTPGPGETASGPAFVNFGWALTPWPKSIPPDGSTITVFVDGSAVGHPAYNFFRSDVAALFPSLKNALGAIGYWIMDTTALSNGVHTIAWSVTDDEGAGEGIGSRFFTVSNGASVLSSMPVAVASQESSPASAFSASMFARSGYDAGPYRTYRADADGVFTIESEEIGRVELLTGASAGHLRTPLGAGPLPPGSHFDPATGMFTWQPGAGFVGTYEFGFTRDDAERVVRVILHAKRSGRVGTQVAIELPAVTASRFGRNGPIVVAGWAVDLDARHDSGIDTIHVWAYPTAGVAPIFVGATSARVAQPEVAAIYGEHFRLSGYRLMVQGLPPGAYDLAVFAHRASAGEFLPAKVVRIVIE